MITKPIKYFFSILLLVAVFSSCQQSEYDQLSSQISDMEKQLFEEKAGIIDKKEAANMIQYYVKFVDTYPEDEKSAEYLFKAADISINVFHSQNTVKLFDRVIKEYPYYEKAPQALFLKAFTYENYLNKMDKAKESYKLFLSKYPDHSFANDAQVSLNNLGKSPEEIIKAFNESRQ
ncbi:MULTISPECIES: tol-pal system YbgF family protein [unclassified Lentimicrobium]|uniref:tetratricopeptide repeat protein n=1 Tax=unclassified Lentimicrobium TaxID=2677434 RepID=UPI0015539CE3|nr:MULTISPECIES: tetratricopeptide repeat protein [unclassified Lentimicrobium]NPD46889.1 tetratricopeptide repeat protein [Lentimicrobium sp. S6]NPD83847.1 tetratricopeptide repeat protein [Lentimicrobium sp. L6]